MHDAELWCKRKFLVEAPRCQTMCMMRYINLGIRFGDIWAFIVRVISHDSISSELIVITLTKISLTLLENP